MHLLLLALRRHHYFRRLRDILVDPLAVLDILLQIQIVFVDLLFGDVNIKPAQFIAQFLELLRLAHLTLQGADLTLHLPEDVCLAQEILLGLLDLPQRLLAVRLELRDTCGFLEYRTTVFRLGRQNRVNLPLRHYRIRTRANASAHEEVLDVPESTRLFVEEVFAGTVAIYAPRDRHFMIVGPQFLLAVGKCYIHFRETERFARVRPVEDYIHKFGASQSRGALLAQNPADCIGDIGFSASVRADDSYKSRIECEPGLVGETLEADYFQLFQIH